MVIFRCRKYTPIERCDLIRPHFRMLVGVLGEQRGYGFIEQWEVVIGNIDELEVGIVAFFGDAGKPNWQRLGCCAPASCYLSQLPS